MPGSRPTIAGNTGACPLLWSAGPRYSYNCHTTSLNHLPTTDLRRATGVLGPGGRAGTRVSP